ncbi:12245_t:CDS:2, partial [Funneliformis caledonium]
KNNDTTESIAFGGITTRPFSLWIINAPFKSRKHYSVSKVRQPQKNPELEFYIKRRLQHFKALRSFTYSHKGQIQGLAKNICKNISLHQER